MHGYGIFRTLENESRPGQIQVLQEIEMNLFWPCYKLAFNVKMESGWSISTKHFLCQVTILFLRQLTIFHLAFGIRLLRKSCFLYHSGL